MESLKLSSIGVDTFIGEFKAGYFSDRAFGGHVVALAAKAALMTIECGPNNQQEAGGYLINSVHCDYVRPGIIGQVSYHVSRVKDGQTFIYRSVEGRQNNKPIVTCLVSFKATSDNKRANLYYNKHPMPSDIIVPKPDAFTQKESFSWIELATNEVTFVNLIEEQPLPEEPRHRMWIKSEQLLPECNVQSSSVADQNDHRLAVLCASDLGVTAVILNKFPHLSVTSVVSLNHSVHFHANHIDFNKWHLSVVECHYSGTDGVTSNSSRIYSHNGDIVASTIQQGYIIPESKL